MILDATIRKIFLALREWEPYLTTPDQDDMGADPEGDPMPEKASHSRPAPQWTLKSALLFIPSTTRCSARESPCACSRVNASLMHFLNFQRFRKFIAFPAYSVTIFR